MKKQALKHLSYRYWWINRRQLVWAVGFGVVSIVLIVGVIVPQITAVTQLYTTKQKHAATTTKLEKKAQELEQYASSSLAAKATKITDTLPSKKPLLEVLTGLNVLAGQTGVKFEDISLNPGKISTESAKPTAPRITAANKGKKTGPAAKTYEQMELQLTISGVLPQINTFVQRVETLAPIATVTKLSLLPLSGKKASEGDEESKFEAELGISAYFFTQSVSTTLEAALPEIGAKEQKTIAELDTFFFPDVSQPQTIQGGGVEDLFNAASLEFIDQQQLNQL
jgi:Tfp pilus assembly protein PilO